MIKPYYQDNSCTLYQGHVLDILKSMEPESIQCVVTSPPYWGLRDYGIEGQVWDADPDCEHEWGEEKTKNINYIQGGDCYRPHNEIKNSGDMSQGQFCQKCNAWKGSLGLEPTPELYIQHMVQVFREVRRVLRKDGTLFLNLGDSYMGSGGAHKEHHKNPGLSKSFERGGVPHEGSYDISGKEPVNYQGRGCLCQNLCDVCREVYRNHRFHNDSLLVSMLIASLSLPNRENKESQNGHFPTLDFSLLENHILNATQDYGNFVLLEGELLHAFQESMPDEFSQQLLDLCWQRGNSSSCLLCGRSLNGSDPVSFRKWDGIQEKSCYNQGSVLSSEKRGIHNQNTNKVCDYCISYKPQCTINNQASQQLKPKDLCGIPWRVALALQADGWWLRSDIIWHKPNPMPESVTDRPTKAHEYIFLLTKNGRYFYDADAVKEPLQESTKIRYQTGWDGNEQRGYIDGKPQNHFSKYMGSDAAKEADGRNKRSVWTIPTKPFPQAHFATFPRKLVEPCVLAGTSEKGCCPECGAPWVRVVEKERTFESGSGKVGNMPAGKNGISLQGGGETLDVRRGPCVTSKTIVGKQDVIVIWHIQTLFVLKMIRRTFHITQSAAPYWTPFLAQERSCMYQRN